MCASLSSPIRFVLKVEDVSFRLAEIVGAGLSLDSPEGPTLGQGQVAAHSPNGSDKDAGTSSNTVILPLVESHGDQV